MKKRRQIPGAARFTRRWWLAVVIVLALRPAAVVASEDLIFWESFENPLIEKNQDIFVEDPIGGFLNDPRSNSIVTLFNDPAHPGSHGAQVLVLGEIWNGGDTTLSTKLAGLIVGQEYRVSLDYSIYAWPAHDYGEWAISIRLGVPGDDDAFIRLAGIEGYFPKPDAMVWWGSEESPWHLLEGSFVASAPEMELFVSGWSRLAYPVIDNVRVIAVPEPGTAALLLVALLAGAAGLRREIFAGSSR